MSGEVGGERILGKRQIGISENNKGIKLNRKCTQQPSVSATRRDLPTGYEATPNVPGVKLTPPATLLPATRAPCMCKYKGKRWYSTLRKQAKGEITSLSYSTTFWQPRERFSVANLVSCKNQRRHKILRILPQERARNAEQVY